MTISPHVVVRRTVDVPCAGGGTSSSCTGSATASGPGGQVVSAGAASAGAAPVGVSSVGTAGSVVAGLPRSAWTPLPAPSPSRAAATTTPTTTSAATSPTTRFVLRAPARPAAAAACRASNFCCRLRACSRSRLDVTVGGVLPG